MNFVQILFLGVMPGRIPGIRVLSRKDRKARWPGTSPAMTAKMDSGTRHGLMA
jgi:hypothetical protein